MPADHQASLRLEITGRNAINAEGRGALGGIVDADYIDRIGNAFTVLAVSLAPFYKNASAQQRNTMDQFLERYYFLGETETSREEYTEGVNSASQELRSLIESF